MATFRGIAFPFGKSSTSFPAAVEDEELIRQSIVQIVTTAVGERVMRPDFGSSAMSYVFENNNDLLAELIREEITTSVSKFEPRAIVRDVQTIRDNNEVTITIIYVVVLTGKQDSVSITVPSAQ
jgi:phage baseplate assembly protein W